MGLHFFETMRGPMVDPAGATHVVDFDVKIEAADTLRFLRTGTARMTGVVRARPWADDAVLEGSFGLSPQGMAYDFTFVDEDERLHTFTGRKHLDPTAPLRTATTLHSELRRGDELLATGVLHFDLNDLPSLATSWRPGSSVRSLDLGQTPMGEVAIPPLGEAELRRARAYAEAILVPGRHVPAVNEDTMEGALAVLGGMPSATQGLYRTALKLLGAASRLRTGRRFEGLSVARRQTVVGWLGELGAGGRGLLLLLGMPIKTGHFARRDYLDAIGVRSYENPVREPEAPWMANVCTPDGLEPVTNLEADVVVIGTGAGGGVMAAELAERGLGVALLEEGQFRGRKDFSGPLTQRLQRFYRDAGMTFSVGNTVISIPLGKVVGGTTTINSGTCFRTPDAVLAEWRERGFPSEFSGQGFDRWFRAVEHELQIAPGDTAVLGKIADVVARGAEELGGEHHPLPRNAPGCDGQGVCPVGCPTDAKRSTNVSYVPRALKAGASLFTGMPVTRIHMRGRRAVAVEARGFSESGERRVLRIKARAIVVACGSLNSPLLLRDNGIRLPQIGRNLSIHPALGMFVRTHEDLNGWNAIPQSYGVTGLVDPRIRFEGFYLPPQLAGGLTPIDAQLLTEWMDDQRRVGQYGFMVRDRSVGRVHRGPGGRPIVHYNLTPDVLELFQKGSAVMAEMLLRGGGHEVMACIGDVGVVRTIDEARALASRPLKPWDVTSVACHPLGSNRMAANEDEGVVDFDHRVFGTDNLYVADGSTVPSSLGVNPQVTIMAMATRAAAGLAERLGA